MEKRRGGGGEEGDLRQLSPDGLSVKVTDTLAGLPGCSHGLLQLEVVEWAGEDTN